MRKAASVERLFDQAGEALALDENAKDVPAKRSYPMLLPKFCFVDGREGDQTCYAPISGGNEDRTLSAALFVFYAVQLKGHYGSRLRWKTRELFLEQLTRLQKIFTHRAT